MAWNRGRLIGICLLVFGITAASTTRGDVLPPVSERFRAADAQEVPSFQKHVIPLFGQLGCNGRACHGSFQGRGGLRLSLFGYDFSADHAALLDKESPRINVEKPLESLIITKPTDADMHEGGKRYELGSWQHHLIRRWLEGGGKWDNSELKKLTALQISPAEMEFSKAGETVQLKAIAVWADGTQEDVTPLCRFQSNDDQVAKVEQSGLVTATDKGDTHVVVFYDKAVIPVPVIRPVSDLVGDKYPTTPTPTKIDELVVAKLRKIGIQQSEVCTDAEFLRRVSLDLTGTLPTAQEVRDFLADTSDDKRAKKVEALLESPAYAAWWTTKLCDFTSNNDQALQNVGTLRGKVTQDWWDWINKRVSENMPYDQLAAGIILGKSRQDGESYMDYCQSLTALARGEEGHSFASRQYMPYYWARANARTVDEKAISFAYSFMGVRIECAQCHKHPFDQWSKDDFDQFKQFFSVVNYAANGGSDSREEYRRLLTEAGIEPGTRNINQQEQQKILLAALKEGKTLPFPEVVVARARAVDRGKNNKKRPPAPTAGTTARLLGGDELELATFEDARQPVMDWLRRSDNRYFAPAFVNRVWANYFNVGIVSPTDDLNLANAPSNKPLLDYLAKSFIEHGYDMKWLHREIIGSRTYQLSWHTNETNANDERNFSHAVPRRLPAEVTYDAVYSATVADARADSMRTDLKGRAIAIPGASTRNNNNGSGFALSVFGRSTRETNCDCDRSMDASLLQTVYMQNDLETKSRLEARDSWVTQLTVAMAKEKKSGNGEDLAAQLKSLERRLERFRKQKDQAQAKKTQDLITELRQQITAEKEAAAKVDPAVVKPLIENAYLRTLSRFPQENELAAATAYVVEDGDLMGGLKDVVWALINTKEFIVNH